MKKNFFAKKIFLCVATLCAAGCIDNVWGEVYRYKDADGTSHYVDSIEKVPPPFRSSATKGDTLPPLSRSGNVDSLSPNSSGSPAVPLRAAKEVEIFVTSWCPVCQALEQYLKRNGIRYRRVDIEQDPAGRKRYISLGGTGAVPLVRIGDQVLEGFNSRKIEQALEPSRPHSAGATAL